MELGNSHDTKNDFGNGSRRLYWLRPGAEPSPVRVERHCRRPLFLRWRQARQPSEPHQDALRRARAGAGVFEGLDAVADLAALSNDPLGDAFTDETWEINHQARARNARLAKAAGVPRYVIPSSCSIYGFFPPTQILDEDCTPNPLTVYAKANLAAEQDIRPLASDDFVVGVLRFATLFGVSPRMRFDLAVNGMTETAWRTGKLALMRDGSQWRPMIHVRDAARAIEFMLEADGKAINGRVFNAGSNDLNVQIRPLADRVAALVPRDVEIDWYGDADTRSYRVAFDRIALSATRPR